MSDNKKQILSMLKTLVQKEVKATIKTEVKRVLRPILKEAVKNQVNAMLAEHFLASNLKPQKGHLAEAFSAKDEEDELMERKRAEKSAAEKKARRQELLEKLGASDPVSRMIFEDVDPSENVEGMALPGTVDENGVYIDSDDEGIDLSALGL